MTRRSRNLFALLLLLCLTAVPQAWAVVVGTFNIEHFTVSGSKAYVTSDLAHLAQTVRRSGADVLALQEIEGNASMRYFVTTQLRGWRYEGNDTGSAQDLFFLWNASKVELLGSVRPAYASQSMVFQGKKYRLFDRPPLMARFREIATGREFTMLNVHLKSMVTMGKADKAAAVRYNNEKRAQQLQKLNELARTVKGPLFILGDYNSEDPRGEGAAFPLKGLVRGWSYDSMRSNLDYIGYQNIHPSRLGPAMETESRIPRRSTKRKEHPDHDIITIRADL